jgi:hypothetical protein
MRKEYGQAIEGSDVKHDSMNYYLMLHTILPLLPMKHPASPNAFKGYVKFRGSFWSFARR